MTSGMDEHMDPTSEITLDVVKERAVKGIAFLSGRYIVLYAVTIISQVFLFALLSTEQWGVFAIVSAVVNFLTYFSDIGLAASLIQHKDRIMKRDLNTTFTVQQLLVVTLLVMLFAATPFIRRFYSLDQAGVYLLWALGASFFLSSLKTIPSVLLERELKFREIALASVVETLLYNTVLVVLAWQGFGVMSFAWAVIVRGFAGLIILYTLKPWIPGIALSKNSLSKLLSFGVPYQINTFIAVLKDDGLTIVLGRVLGLSGIGILLFSQKWVQLPLRIVLDNVTKVTFPAFSRMQDEKDELAKSVTRSLFFITFLVFPAAFGFLLIAPELMHIVPRYEKWLPATVPIVLLGMGTLISAVSTQLTNTLNAIGKIKLTMQFMLMWAGLSWLLIPTLASRFGVNGAALGYLLVSGSSFLVFIVVKRFVAFSLWEGAGKAFISAFLMGLVLYILRYILPTNIYSLAAMITVGSIVYVCAMYSLVGETIIKDAKKGISAFTGK